jgi:putative flavoprotein involved in K+ transport
MTERWTGRSTEHFHVAVVGGGQAGLAVSYHLRQRGLDHVVLDASEHAGDPWRMRWDSLRLFTPARLDHLDGMNFPGPSSRVPTKDEFADYLAAYEQQFELPVRHGTRVHRLSAGDDGFVLDTSISGISADAVVVAMSSLQAPYMPAMAGDLDPSIRSMHSVTYRNPAQLQEGAVLVVGVGNTGAEIGIEVAQTHETWLAGAESGQLPFRVDGFFGRHVGTRIVAALFLHVLTTDTAIGRKLRPTMTTKADLLLRERPGELRRSGVRRVPRIDAVRDGLPVAADGTVLEVANVIWCTGFRAGLTEWVDIPVLDERGLPRHRRGVVADQPGLYFVGQNFLFAKASEQIPGVSRDARYVVGQLEQWLAQNDRVPEPA